MKQFKRYRQIADQKMGRANKSEVLSEELLQVEKHIEHVRAACQSTYKKLSQCMQTHSAGDYEKRLKRLSENNLAQTMQNASKNLLTENDVNHFLGASLKMCADAQAGLAKEKAMYEMFIDDHIIAPLQQLVETEIPAIQKQRAQLKKLVLDRDSACQDYHKAQKAQFTPGANLQQATAKEEQMKDEYDQAVSRMEQCKDQLVTEMFEYLTREAGHGQRLVDLHAKQLDYHRRCMNLLENLMPQINDIQEKAHVSSSYGRSLSEHLKLSEREIASPIEACVSCVLEYGLKEEGIFRVGGAASKLRKFKAIADGGVLDLASYDAQDDIHAVSGALKQYLRDLPDPLLTHELYEDWMNCSNIQDRDEKFKEIWTIINKLPSENRANLRYLMKFCAVVADHQDVNKMSASNLAVVFAPNLLWSNLEDMSKRMLVSNVVTNIVDLIISNIDYFFPGEIEFSLSSNVTSNGNSANYNEKAPVSPGFLNKPATHARTPSTDLNTPDSSTKVKRSKSKAPPPPPQAQTPRNHEQAKSNSSAAPNTSDAPSRPPVAAKRLSIKKPQKPPPQPPKDDRAIGDEATSNHDKVAKPRPRPPVRKNPGTIPEHAPRSKIPPPVTISEPDSLIQDEESHSPPMPTLPPPPLPADIDLDMGASLTSELQVTTRTSYVSNEEDNPL